jgi:hypothetical protein
MTRDVWVRSWGRSALRARRTVYLHYAADVQEEIYPAVVEYAPRSGVAYTRFPMLLGGAMLEVDELSPWRRLPRKRGRR